MERLSERETRELERLAALGLPSRLIGRQIGRHHRAVWGHISRLRRPPAREPVRSLLRLSLAEREEISRGLAGGESLRVIYSQDDCAEPSAHRTDALHSPQ